MSFILQGPVPLLQTTTVLPSPQLNDSDALQNSVKIMYSMTGVRYTYIKTGGRTKLHYDFLLSRMKALELRAFITSYSGAQMRITNHFGEVWNVYLTNNPFEFVGEGRANGIPGGEMMTITLEFEGTMLSAATNPPSC